MSEDMSDKKRKPNEYNLFMKECLLANKDNYPDIKERFSLCVDEWKNKKK